MPVRFYKLLLIAKLFSVTGVTLGENRLIELQTFLKVDERLRSNLDATHGEEEKGGFERMAERCSSR